MKRFLITSLIVLLSVNTLFAQKMKIVERSSKKTPGWLYGTEKDYFISNKIAPTVDEAKEMCLTDVKRQIIEAVALNIKSTTSSNLSQETNAEEVIKFLQTLDSKMSTEAAKIPFIEGISLSKVDDFYWEKQEISKGKYQYSYSIKYPYSNAMLNRNILKFRETDNEMSSKLVDLEAAVATISSVEQITEALSSLESLKKYFFDDTRRNKTDEISGSYRRLYQAITIKMISHSKNEFTVALALNGMPLRSVSKPLLKSNCGTLLQSETLPNGDYKITYDSSACVDTEENYIDVSFRFGGRLINNKYYFHNGIM